MLAQARLRSSSAELTWRVLALLNLLRLLIGVLMGALYFVIEPRSVGQDAPLLFIVTAIAYFLFAVICIPAIKARWPRATTQTLLGVSIDIVAIGLLIYASGGMGSGLGSLLVLPIGVVGFVLPRQLALMFAAAATLVLLLQQALTALAQRAEIGEFTSTGILGILLFALALGVNRLGTSLRESEERARQSEVDVANLAELNQFIVQNLRESILVVDSADAIRLINESAAALLNGGPVPAGTALEDIAPRLRTLLHAWRAKAYDWQLSTTSLLTADGSSLLQPHFISLRSGGEGGPTLIFLEDTSLIASRVQQTKLAALGRLSASIAHEIRNPVGAMSHAAQLLAEAPQLSDQDRRFTDIIIKNGERVSTIINNVLQLSRRDSTRRERLELQGWLTDFLSEFLQTTETPAQRILVRADSPDVEVRADPSHLHQLLWNLCENALKYGTGPQGSEPIEIRIARIPTSDRPMLEVMDRGPGIDPADAERIFEPFYAGQRRGTGLGLFIARELAQCNGAALIYEPRQGGGSIFRVVFADPHRWEP